jgi:hypothetical protein
MDWYLEWVKASPFVTAFVQFALLGTLGEILSITIRSKRATLPCGPFELLLRMAAWGVLGIIIKLGFTGMRGFVAALDEHHLVPLFFSNSLGMAFVISVNTNLFFGPQMMFIHRLEENLIARRWNMAGLQKAWLTLLWFWIPAHTITFSLPRDYQIGLAALWSVVLGLIMGMTAPKAQA